MATQLDGFETDNSGVVASRVDKLFFENLVWFSTRHARDYLGLDSDAAVRAHVYRGNLHCSGRLGRHYRFQKSDLDAALMRISQRERARRRR